ncbi:MAG TPA: hypothetical protein VGO48_15675 [Conexibacter sp.]|jgi:hypothetical protein|nr:hypothetical protein [Conexibacter sp.]
MKLNRLLFAAVGAAVLLGALVSSASAGRLSHSSLTLDATYARMDIRGGLGTVECEVITNETLHTRAITKTRLLLMGYITAANVNRCARGGATFLRETLPWHVRYDSFTGTLPNITGLAKRVIGVSERITEPVFRISCLFRTTPETPFIQTTNLTGGTITTLVVGGSIACNPGSILVSMSGSTNNVVDAGGARVTITLI